MHGMISATHGLSKYAKKFGGQRTRFWAMVQQKRACFWPFFAFFLYKRAHGLLSLTCAYDLIRGRKWQKFIGSGKWNVRNPNQSKKLFICVPYVLRAQKTRARTCTRVKFWNAQNGLKRTQKKFEVIWRTFFALKRAYAHFLARAGTVMAMRDDPWTEVYVC